MDDIPIKALFSSIGYDFYTIIYNEAEKLGISHYHKVIQEVKWI